MSDFNEIYSMNVNCVIKISLFCRSKSPEELIIYGLANNFPYNILIVLKLLQVMHLGKFYKCVKFQGNPIAGINFMDQNLKYRSGL